MAEPRPAPSGGTPNSMTWPGIGQLPAFNCGNFQAFLTGKIRGVWEPRVSPTPVLSFPRSDPFPAERTVVRPPVMLLAHEPFRSAQAARPERPSRGLPGEPQDHRGAVPGVRTGLAPAGRRCRRAVPGHRMG